MKTLKVRGLVLKEYETGEADKRLLLLCKEFGRVMAYARGARKPRSKFLAAAQIFTYSDFVLAEGRGFFSVAQADVIESFYALRTDYDTLAAAHFITDVCDKTVWADANCDALLLLVLKSLRVLTKGIFPPMQVTAVFLLRFFDFYGVRPKIENAALITDSEQIAVSEDAARAAEYIFESEPARAFMFEASAEVLEELQNASQRILRGLVDG